MTSVWIMRFTITATQSAKISMLKGVLPGIACIPGLQGRFRGALTESYLLIAFSHPPRDHQEAVGQSLMKQWFHWAFPPLVNGLPCGSGPFFSGFPASSIKGNRRPWSRHFWAFRCPRCPTGDNGACVLPTTPCGESPPVHGA